MRSKKWIAVLLTLCLVLTVFAPAASAVQVGSSGFRPNQSAQQGSAGTNNSRPGNDLLVSGNNGNNGSLYLRDYLQNTVTGNQGLWSFAPSEGEVDITLKTQRLNAVLEELKSASELYSSDEVVSAFVVMEGAALAATYSSMSQVKKGEEQKLIDAQNLVIKRIEKNVLAGGTLNVRYQFTYLANAFSILTKFENLAEIAKLDGVQTVFVMPTYDPMSTADPNTFASGAMTGVHNVWKDLAFTGTGMRIAIVDTGLDLDHPSFAADPALSDASMVVEDVDNVVTLLHAYDKMAGKLTAEELYRSAKVPYAFNYVDANLTADHSDGKSGDHGTHVAGIAAANKLEGTEVVGMAPDAQIIVMKVFGANGGAYMDDYVAAIEDAMILDCDVVNLSLGSDSGFTNSGREFADSVFANLRKQDIIATISAGNSGVASTGNMWGTDLNRTQNPENGVVGSPSTYVNAFSIASAGNSVIMWENFVLADGTRVFYMPSIEILYGEVPPMEYVLSGEYEYVIVDGLGAPEDFYDAEGNSLVDGKVAVVKRGELNFGAKVNNAAAAGAVACLIWNNNADDDIFSFGMTTEVDGENPTIPASLITLEDGQKMADMETKTMLIHDELAGRVVEGGQMSNFSSWGTTSDLRLVPDITGIGGNVYSCYDNGQYGLMSGTSMSAPQVAGVSALVLQHLKEKYPELAKQDNGYLREMAQALLMSTANPVISSESGLEASPRQQGAGLIDALAAITSSSYLTVNGERPKVEMKDNETGVYNFSFEIHNTSDKDQTYTMSSSLLTEEALYGMGQYFMAGYERELTGSVDYGAETITVFAGQTATVNVRVTLSEEDKAYFAECWKNGGYVEGFIYLESEDDVDLNLPFFGFYGDWNDAPIFDTAMWWSNSMWGVPSELPEGDQYQTVLWTGMGASDWVLGFNPYSGAVADENGNIIYDPSNNVLSPNGDGYLDEITEMYVSLLRNVKEMSITWSAGEKIYQRDWILNAPKSAYNSNYGQVIPWIGTWYYGATPFFNELPNGLADLPNDTQLTLTFEAVIDYPGAEPQSLSFPIYIDNTAPTLLNVFDAPQLDGSEYLVIDVKENHKLASIVVTNASGNSILTQVYDEAFVQQKDGTYRAYVDVTDLGTEFKVILCDYAANESTYDVVYEAATDDNLPVMDTNLLYGYRVFDFVTGYYYGQDHMYGWVSMNKPQDDPAGYGSWIEVLTDDYREYYSINAAEYAGGKIFAFDAGGQFLLINPGLWDRQVIGETGLNVMDMAFDDTTDLMYVLTKDGSNTSLYTIDLLTAEMTMVYDFGSYNAPHTLTIGDDGTMYCCVQGKSGLYTINNYGGSYFYASPIYDEDWNVKEFLDHEGNPVLPKYYQSMTFVDGKIYWAYFSGSSAANYASILVIDPEDGYSYEAYPYVTYYPDFQQALITETEIVGLLSLEETDFQFPEGDELMALRLSSTWEALAVGKSVSLSAKGTPWNYKLGKLTWTSSDTSVATVDEHGIVTAVGAGKATITVSHGDVTAECEIVVAEVKGGFYAFDLYNYEGSLMYVNSATMGTSEWGTPANGMVAGAYNGHDGVIYGYDNNNQFFIWDTTTGEATIVGEPSMVMPWDMAYDYTTGMLWATAFDNMMGCSYIYQVDRNTGTLVPYALCYDALMTLTIDKDGRMLAMTSGGSLVELLFVDGADWGMEIMMAGYDMPILENLGELVMLQSMTYDWENDVLLWACPEHQVVYWIDYNSEEPYAMPIGCPMPSGMQLTSMFTVPEEDQIPELPEVAVESVTVADMTILTGDSKLIPLSILPLNANGYVIDMVSSDETVISVADGIVTGVGAGEATITVTVTDEYAAEPIVETIHVNVLQAADNAYAFMAGDLATMMGGFWFTVDLVNTRDLETIFMTGVVSEYMIYAGEYYDGKLYAVGYSFEDYSANWQLIVLDPLTKEVEKTIDLGENCPFIYDMTYDYTTSTMYITAGQGSDDTDLYALNLETGEMMFMLDTPCLLSLAAGPDGVLYGIEKSQVEGDMWDPWAPMEEMPAVLYAMDPLAGTIEAVGSTGVIMNALSSMSYDYDTGRMYWTGVSQSDGSGGLSIVDLETGEALVIDKFSTMGASVTSLYFICDEYPEETENGLHMVDVDSNALTYVGSGAQLNLNILPFGLDAEIKWVSSDETVATVDENGQITGVAAGTAEITVTVTCNGQSMTDTCQVTVLAADASFLTYNATDKGWALISRKDGTVTMLNSGEEDAVVTAITMVDNKVYGYDQAGNLFVLDAETLERTVLGAVDKYEMLYNFWGSDDFIPEYYRFTVRDLTYDAANERVLALGVITEFEEEWGEWELYGGTAIYEVDMTTGALEVLAYLEGYSGVQGLAIDNDGFLYFESTYMDYYSRMDLTTGEIVDLFTTQRLGLHTSSEHAHDLYYDEITNRLFHLNTQNGDHYWMFSLGLDTLDLTVDYPFLGEADEYGYGDHFSGLLFLPADAGFEAPSYEAEFVSASATLDGNIGLNFYVTLSEDLVNAADGKMVFLHGEDIIEVPVSEADISVKNEQTRYRFTIQVDAAEMADVITAQMFVGSNPVGEAQDYSVQKYAMTMINLDTADAELKSLMKAMLNYGAAAQAQFGYDVENLANAELEAADKVLPEIAPEDLDAYKHSITGTAEGLEAKSASLRTMTGTVIRVYFALTGDKTIDQYTFKVDGVVVTPVQDGDRYYIEAEDIAAGELFDMHTFTADGITITYSPMSYVRQMLTSTDENTVNLVKALYAYGTAAEAYFG